MNKITKASIATAAGVLLLLGGGGTFASWNASADIAGAEITAGNLVVTDPGTEGTWAANGDDINIAAYRVVPGDVLTFTKTMSIVAEGDSLSATLALSEASITPANPANAVDQALVGYLEANAVLTAEGAGITQSADGFTVAPGAAGIEQDVTVTVTITFPYGTEGSNNDAKTGAVNLNDLSVTLTQHTAAA
ncbi:alternate-type signal peptide domain-containing protein [Microbacterium sp. zg-Y818]|uniref:alternate-type signal peptide domain-containing protein n=1 Tax=unclassified Microbacterium TaxID=2609290 RepID=UPI00214AB838|nr:MULTISPECIES: alternate-type signal peptide domain-containing protein [unclassified Microbacterium]MCR2800377.1 alternate-type signal peptide domain-containing protein [Microbacterium sp. zg.Y818]WIM22337.1 alternate-type signal peptide domain-containing protein [Microbacterium sp. zg-Y818]